MQYTTAFCGSIMQQSKLILCVKAEVKIVDGLCAEAILLCCRIEVETWIHLFSNFKLDIFEKISF